MPITYRIPYTLLRQVNLFTIVFNRPDFTFKMDIISLNSKILKTYPVCQEIEVESDVAKTLREDHFPENVNQCALHYECLLIKISQPASHSSFSMSSESSVSSSLLSSVVKILRRVRTMTMTIIETTIPYPKYKKLVVIFSFLTRSDFDKDFNKAINRLSRNLNCLDNHPSPPSYPPTITLLCCFWAPNSPPNSLP